MPQARQSRLILLALWLAFYASFTLFTPPLLDDADSVHAEVAREMLFRHDYVTLYANGIRYLEKAPVFYWSMAASMRVFGPTTAASRVTLAIAMLALTLLIEAFARRAFASPRAGLYAGLITLSSFGLFIFSRINIPDILVCVFLTAALYAFHQTENPGAPHLASEMWGTPPSTNPVPLAPCLLFASACALDVLTKGLIGIVFPVAIVALYLLLTRGPRGTLKRLARFHVFTSSALFLAITLPWHILIAQANPTQGHPGALTFAQGHWQVPLPTDGNVHGWAWFYFVNEQVLRYLNLRRPADEDTAPLFLFLGLIFVWLIPWSAFLPSALRLAWPTWRGLRTHSLAPDSRINLFLLIWTAVPLLFFSLSTRQEYYVLPSLPPLILLIARFLERASLFNNHSELSQPAHPSYTFVSASVTVGPTESTRAIWCGVSARRIATALLILGTIVSLVLTIFLLKTRSPSPTTDLASLLQQNPADYALSFGHFLDLNAQALGLFKLPLALTAIAFFGGTLAHFLLRRATRPHAATLALTAAAFLFLIAAHRGLTIFAPTISSYRLAESIRPQLHSQDLLAIHGEYEAGSTLGFYLQRSDIHLIEGRSSNLWYGSFFSDAPRIFDSPASFVERWQGPQRIFLWQDPSDKDRPILPLAPAYVIASSGGKQILSNQPNH